MDRPPIDENQFVTTRFARGAIFFNLGPAVILSGPADTTPQPIGSTANFTVALDGTPPYIFNWKTNGVLVAGANSSTLSIPNIPGAMDGTHVSVCVSNACGGACSGTATLHILLNPVVVSVGSKGNCHAIYVDYNKPMQLDGTYTVLCSNTVDSTVTPLTITGKALGGFPERSHPERFLLRIWFKTRTCILSRLRIHTRRTPCP